MRTSRIKKSDRAMNAERTQEQFDNSPHLAEFPALNRLRLKEHDLKELSRQGSLAMDRRGQRAYAKLRFRRDGRQIVRYVGGAERAQAVAAELAVLQHDHRLQHHLDELGCAAVHALRVAKQKARATLSGRRLPFPRRRNSQMSAAD